MYDCVHDYVKIISTWHGLTDRSVLEVGSLDVNGNVRDIFSADYLGIDMREGPGVDLLCNSNDMRVLADASFEVVLCLETLEHDKFFWLTLSEIGRVLADDGFLIVTVPENGWPQHDYPGDYWRFIHSSSEIIMRLAGCEVLNITHGNRPMYPGLYMTGKRSRRSLE